MRLAAIPMVLSIGLLATPAFAQNNAMDNGQSNGQYSQANRSSQNENHPNNGSAMNRNQSYAQGLTRNTRQKIRQALEQNGFRNIQVVPEAFMIRAQAPDGSRVMMQVSPDQFAEVISRTNGSGSSANGSRGMTQPNEGQNGQSETQGSGASKMGPGTNGNNNWGNNQTGR